VADDAAAALHQPGRKGAGRGLCVSISVNETRCNITARRVHIVCACVWSGWLRIEISERQSTSTQIMPVTTAAW
jgi:hypothetical protein